MFGKVTSMLVLVMVSTSSAHADPHDARYRHLDELTFAAFVEARELRWEIHNDFIESNDYKHLLADADEVVEALHNVQINIYRERPDQLIAREIDLAQKKLSNLTTHLHASDYARVSHSRHKTAFNGRGYDFTPESRHVGRVHIAAALKMVHRIDSALSALEREVRPQHLGHAGSRLGPPTIEEAPRPAPLAVPREASNRNYLEIPVGEPGKGGFVFKIGY